MKILGIDSSGLVAAVAVWEDGILLGEYATNYKKTHSQTLLPMLDELKKMIELDLQTLDAIAVAAGPGSFTGLRIGAATAKGLGLALKKPLVEVPTLEGLAYNLVGVSDLVCPIMDARRNQVYTGIYEFIPQKTQEGEREYQLRTVREQAAMDIRRLLEEVAALGRDVVFLGDGVSVYRDVIRQECKVGFSFAAPHMNAQRGASVAALGAVYFAQGRGISAAQHQPEYLRKSQAEREREERGKKKSAEETPAGFLEIVPLQEEHISALAGLEQEIFSQPWSKQAFQNLLTRDYCRYFVAVENGKPVGMAGMTALAGEGDIDKVMVAPDRRRRGIADRLLKALFQEGKELGITAYTLEVRAGNIGAIRLYEKNGFLSEGVRPGFYEKPAEDALIMWKR